MGFKHQNLTINKTVGGVIDSPFRGLCIVGRKHFNRAFGMDEIPCHGFGLFDEPREHCTEAGVRSCDHTLNFAGHGKVVMQRQAQADPRIANPFRRFAVWAFDDFDIHMEGLHGLAFVIKGIGKMV